MPKVAQAAEQDLNSGCLPLVCLLWSNFSLVFLVSLAFPLLLTTRVMQQNSQFWNNVGRKQQTGSLAGQPG